MISNNLRESRRNKPFKMTPLIERLYKEGKCSQCSVVVTRMDFAKILGKFTKVKIQYEASSSPKSKKTQLPSSPNSRLKNNENGMVLIHRNAYTKHPAKELLGSKKLLNTDKNVSRTLKENTIARTSSTLRQAKNILKENNRLKKEDSQHLTKDAIDTSITRYGIIFVNPNENNIICKSPSSLSELLPYINESILPTEEWSIDFLPKKGEPKEDKVYDRIAAELEDLMNNEAPAIKAISKAEPAETKDEFPSIMDILNENTDNSQVTTPDKPDKKSNLESSDVEAMLLGKSNATRDGSESMEVDDVANLLGVAHEGNKLETVDNPHSPSILDEALQKGIEQHLPISQSDDDALQVKNNELKNKENHAEPTLDLSTVTHVVFKKSINGQCQKSVTCPKNLKYSVEIEGKSVEFLGAPKFVSKLEDIQVLLQILNETELSNFYVLH